MMLALALLPLASAFGPNAARDPATLFRPKNLSAGQTTPSDLKIAFIGDGGIGTNFGRVLQQMKAEGVQAVFHSGDYDYENAPVDWDAQISSVLGEDFPYFASMGNHDVLRWSVYQDLLLQRISRLNGSAVCTGDYGRYSVCSWNGIVFTLNGMGIAFTGHEEYVNEAFLGNPNAVWRICSWHYNHRTYQVGGKLTGVSYELYDMCRIHGAIIATGHEHSYARTHTMLNMAEHTVASTNNTLSLSPGSTFAFCHGLGGRSIRGYTGELKDNPWWAATAASEDGVSYGALICTINIGGDISKGSCHFTDLNGRVWDSFGIVNTNGATNLVTEQPSKCVSLHEVAVAQHSHDMIVDYAGRTHCAAENGVMSLSPKTGKIAQFRFDNIPLSQGEEVLDVHIQMLNDDSLTRISAAPAFYVRVGTLESECDTVYSAVSAAEDFVVWNGETGDFEDAVWSSADISGLVQQIVNDNSWKFGNSLVVEIEVVNPDDGDVYAFFAADHSAAYAPTIVIETKPHC
eukprot:TRINITY_DN1793_c0_g1_i1.p1 TRINITY_DN1793_c0_g1~~TRINITY_DN1793_c0_g1_i1.p1  ORF type:complete len:528 (-),score=151.15 TRINITY_DN1793_c0_g1_i1:40-1587(-)